MRKYNDSRKFLEDIREKMKNIDKNSKLKVNRIRFKQCNEEDMEKEEVESEPIMNKLLEHKIAAMPYPNSVHQGTLYMMKHTFLDVIGNTRWEMNRQLDEEHINNLFNCYEREKINGKNNLSFLSHIDMAYVISGNYIRVIDGQHRMEALKDIRLKYHDYGFYIPVVIWNVNTELDMMNLLHLINHKKAFDMNLIKYDEAEFLSEMDKKFRVGRYRSIFGKKRPHIDKDKFLEKIEEKFKIWKYRYGEISNLIRKIEEINNYIKNNIKESWSNSMSVKQKANDMGFYLGLDRDMGWVDRIYKFF